MLKRICCWAMLLIQLILFGRASCMTEFCPNMLDVELPAAEAQWDADGLPKYIIIGMRAWKWRTACNRCNCPSDKKCTCGNVYKMMVFRNCLDPRFCPVFWFLTWISYSHIESGPIFQSLVRGGDNKGQVVEHTHFLPIPLSSC